MFEVRDRASGRRLSRHAEEGDARADVAARLAEADRDPLIALDRLEVWSDADGGAMCQLDAGVTLARWVAFGSAGNPAETVTETRPATDDELAFLKRRQSSLGTEIIIYCCGAAAITFILIFLTALAMGGGVIGAILGGIVAIFIVGAGFAVAEGKRQDLKREARSGVVTIKRGPFRAFTPPVKIGPSGTVRRGGGAGADVYYAEFADASIEVDMAIGQQLIRLGPLLSATVVLFPRAGQIVEILSTDGALLFRNPDYWPTSFRPSGGTAPVEKDEPVPEP